MSVNRELNSMEKRRDTILDDDNENAIKLNDEDRNTITKNLKINYSRKHGWYVFLQWCAVSFGAVHFHV